MNNNLPFNVNEYCSWILSQGSPHNCIIVAGVKGLLELNRLQQAVEEAGHEQPMLGFSISANHCGFIKTHKKLGVQCVAGNREWRNVAEDELSKPFIDTEALAQITVINSGDIHYILLCFHHVIGDGASGIQFLLRIIEIYNNAHVSITTNEIECDIPASNVTPYFDKAEKPECATKITGISIDNERMRQVESKAKKLGCSLNAYLSAKLVQAAGEIFKVPSFDISMAVDLRRKIKGESFVPLKFLTSWIDFKANIETDNFAETMHKHIRRCFREKQQFQNLNVLNEMVYSCSNNANFAKAFISTQPTICISNSGITESPFITPNNKDELKVVELHLSVNAQSYMGTKDSFTVQLSRLKEQGQFINVNYPDPLVSGKKIDSFLECFENSLIS